MTASSISPSIWVGLATALLLTLLGVAYLATLAAGFIRSGLSFPPPAPVQLAGAIVSILTSLALVFLMAALRRQVAGDRQVFSDLSLVFMALLCAMTCANRFVQLGVVPQYPASDYPHLNQLIHPYGPRSMLLAFESLGWGLFYGLGALCAAFAFGGSGLEGWIRWLFLTGGLFSLLFTTGYLTRRPALNLFGFPAWSVLLTVTSGLLAVWFWNLASS